MENMTKIQAFEAKNKYWRGFFIFCLSVSIIYFLLLKGIDLGIFAPYPIGNFNVPFLIFTTATGVIFFKYLISWKKDPDFQEIITSKKPPAWLDWSYPFFPWLLVYCVLRLFVYEPYVIPSGSMLPTLQIKTLIFVNKHDRVILNPLNNNQIAQVAPFKRGEILVFKYPLEPQIIYVKRAVGIPGDTISWNWNKETLSVNGKEVTLTDVDKNSVKATMPGSDGKDVVHLQQKRQEGEKINLPDSRTWNIVTGKENCVNTEESLTCKIPEGYYFMMGDNRNESSDSRFWGMLPHNTIIGKASFQVDVFNLKVEKF